MAISKMKIIPKEKSWIGYDINCKFYCFEQKNENYYPSKYNYYFKFLSDITVNENNQLHSFNDEPLIYINEANILCKEWFINGKNIRLNPEKPCLIIKGWGYYFNDGSYVSIENLKDKLK